MKTPSQTLYELILEDNLQEGTPLLYEWVFSSLLTRGFNENDIQVALDTLVKEGVLIKNGKEKYSVTKKGTRRP